MELLYKSTRGGRTATASEAILKGLSEDGGLFVPERIPALDKTFRELGQMSYGEVAYEVMKLGYTNVMQMPDGIYGWKLSGRKFERP